MVSGSRKIASIPVFDALAGDGWAADLLRAATELPEHPPTRPEGFSGELRSYQAEAHTWLGFLDGAGLGAVHVRHVRRHAHHHDVHGEEDGEPEPDQDGGGRAVVAAITLSSGATAWFWKIAYDEDLAHCSPGVQLAVDLQLRSDRPDMARSERRLGADKLALVPRHASGLDD